MRTQLHIVLKNGRFLTEFCSLTLIPGQSHHCQQQRSSLLWITASEAPGTQTQGELFVNMLLFFLADQEGFFFLFPVQLFWLPGHVLTISILKLENCMHSVCAVSLTPMQLYIASAAVI